MWSEAREDGDKPLGWRGAGPIQNRRDMGCPRGIRELKREDRDNGTECECIIYENHTSFEWFRQSVWRISKFEISRRKLSRIVLEVESSFGCLMCYIQLCIFTAYYMMTDDKNFIVTSTRFFLMLFSDLWISIHRIVNFQLNNFQLKLDHFPSQPSSSKSVLQSETE